VVDSDDTAQKVLNIMLREKTGRVTFMPLNRLKPKKPTFPQSTDAIPLLSKIEYDSQYEKAFQQVFGKTAVCKDLTIAAAYSRSHSLNTITLDGDKVERKGAMTGGWHDIRRSRLEAAKSLYKWNETFEKDGARSKEVKQAITRIDQEITRLTGQMQVLEGQRTQAQSSREPFMAEAAQLDREKLMVSERLSKLEKEVEGLEADLVDYQAKIEAYQADLEKPLENSLTRAEEELIAALSKEVDDRNQSWSRRVSQKNEVKNFHTVSYKSFINFRAD
jgi:structural maintenance of chromosome 3 (chondroitin sulfate proteoglycan 6)